LAGLDRQTGGERVAKLGLEQVQGKGVVDDAGEPTMRGSTRLPRVPAAGSAASRCANRVDPAFMLVRGERRMRDSNSRGVSPNTLSKRAP
jgi:hypothetical protein